jgi:hypothetical protein
MLCAKTHKGEGERAGASERDRKTGKIREER